MTPKGRVEAFVPVPGVSVPLGLRRRWLAIPGSCGQPRDGNPAASYALLDVEKNAMTWFRVPYDHERAARKIWSAGLPESFGDRLLDRAHA
jgi:diadenosine tetraphosphatase ApaH/serine/threonine PP2A family protein phosphatase